MSEKRLSLSPARFLSARRRHRSAGLVVLLFGLLAVGSAYAAFAPDNAVADNSAQSQQIEEGKKLFAVGCASCHGLNAEGGGNGEGKMAGPSLIGVGAAAVDFQVGTGRMPAMQPGAQIPRKTAGLHAGGDRGPGRVRRVAGSRPGGSGPGGVRHQQGHRRAGHPRWRAVPDELHGVPQLRRQGRCAAERPLRPLTDGCRPEAHLRGDADRSAADAGLLRPGDCSRTTSATSSRT